MNLTQSERFHNVVAQGPESNGMRSLALEIAHDHDMRDVWFDFLVEQFLSDQLDASWIKVTEEIPDFAERIAFQNEVCNGIRVLHETDLKKEIHAYLPKRQIDIKPVGSRRIVIRRLAVVAAIAAILITSLIWLQKPVLPGGPPVLVIEHFELEGVSEEMLVHGISQRIPAKLAATEGILPVPFSAVDSVIQRTGTTTPAMVLNAAYTLRGSVSRAGNLLHINANFINVNTNKTIWNKTYQIADNAKEFDDVQDSMVLDIAKALNVPVSEGAMVRLKRDISNNKEVVTHFLKGERKLVERTQASLRDAIFLFRRALEKDPNSVVTRGFLSLAYDIYASNGFGDIIYWDTAVTIAKQVLVIDPGNPEALLTLGHFAQLEEKDYPKAASYFEKASMALPGDARIHQAMAELYYRTGDIEIGIRHINIACLIEPEHRAIRWVETKYLTATGRLEDARIAADMLIALYPHYPNIQNFYWEYYLSKREFSKAIDAIPDDTSHRSYFLGMVYLEQKDYNALYDLIPELADPNADFTTSDYSSLKFLEYTQKDQWEQAHALLSALLETDEFDLLPRLQTADFRMFDKVKRNPGVQEILAEYGIKAHIIPHEELEI